MAVVDFMPLTIHLITADSYIVGRVLLPCKGTGGRPPRFLDVLNSPAVFLKNPGEVPSDSAILISDGTIHSFHGGDARAFRRAYIRLDTVLIASDEAAPGSAGTGVVSPSSGTPEEMELRLSSGVNITGVVRGGSRVILYPRADHFFIAATNVEYNTPVAPDQKNQLGFAAINSRKVELAIRLSET